MGKLDNIMVFGWTSFAIVCVFIVVFAVVYILRYRSLQDKECLSTIISTFALFFAFFSCCLLPVDIFLVSETKYANGTYKQWADIAIRHHMENSVLYTYYAVYTIICAFVFFILPLAFFYYDDLYEDIPTSQKCCTALKCTLIPVFCGLLVFLTGAFVPFKKLQNDTGLLTDILTEAVNFKDGGNQHWTNAISFSVTFLTTFGMVFLVFYTGVGMSTWPLDLVRGRRSVDSETADVEEEQQDIERQINAIKQKYNAGQRMARIDRRKIEELEDKMHKKHVRHRHLTRFRHSVVRRCGNIFRPVKIAIGLFFFLLALLIVVSQVMINIDRLVHASWKTGYILPNRISAAPIDIILTYAQVVFPVDYLLMISFIVYFFFCTMAGFRNLGIRCFCIKLYKVLPFRTRPQALVLLSFKLMLIVLAITMTIFQLAPTYTMFGFQHYWNAASNRTEQCSISAPNDECAMTRVGWLITRFSYKFWFFAVCYFWLSWCFVLMVIISFIVTLIRERRSSVESMEDIDSLADSDDELLQS